MADLSDIDPKTVLPGPIRHDDLGPILTLWARRLYVQVGHHLYDTYEEWDEGFRRDAQPQSEMFVFECIARAGEAYLFDHPECDKPTVASDLIRVSVSRESEDDTEQIQELRVLYHRIWGNMTEDPQATWEKVRQSLLDGLSDK